MAQMRSIAGLLVAVAVVRTCLGEEVRVPLPQGTARVMTLITLDASKRPSLMAEITNESALPVQRIELCISSPSVKEGCLFTIWTKEELAAAAKVTVSLSSARKIANTSHTVFARSIDQLIPRPPNPLDTVLKIYVAEIGGNAGPMLREELVAALINSRRFSVVKDPAVSDGTIVGRAESRDSNLTTGSSNSFGVGNLSATLGIGANGNQVSAGRSDVVSRSVVAETVAIHLTTTGGASVWAWAWDGTSSCPGSKAKCAISNLMDSAR
jgi:hypothetical protein